MAHAFWDHPDWYDCHDNTSIAGPDREPEHHREFLIALPPIDAGDHVVDVGAGTGKLSLLVANAYPKVGRITLVEPNGAKLERAGFVSVECVYRFRDRVVVRARHS